MKNSARVESGTFKSAIFRCISIAWGAYEEKISAKQTFFIDGKYHKVRRHAKLCFRQGFSQWSRKNMLYSADYCRLAEAG